MKQILLYSLMIAVLGLIIGCAPQAENPEQLLADAKALDQEFVEAYNNGDVDAIMDTYWNSPELISYPADMMEVRGWEANKEAFKKAFANQPSAELELLEPNNTVIGDAVIGTGKWRFTMTLPGDVSMVVEGRYTDVKTRVNGKLVYIVDHASVPLPPPPDSPEM